MTEPTTRRFPAPWTVVELHDSFRIVDANGMHLAYVHYDDDSNRRDRNNRMSKDEARQIAVSIAAVPEMRKALRDDRDG